MNSEIRDSPRYDGIQVLRAVAATLVVWAHLKFAAHFGANKFVASASGASGVDIFFVISGFVICISAERLDYQWFDFMRKRFCRVVPFYWLMTLCCWAIRVRTLHVSVDELVTSFLFLPLVSFQPYMFTLHDFGWTLSFEIWFYLIFSVLLAMKGRRASVSLMALLSVGSVVVALCYHGSYFLPRFLFNPITLDFVCGVLIYKFRRRLGRSSVLPAATGVLFLGALTLLTGQLGWHQSVLGDPRLGFERVLVWGMFGASLVACCVALDQTWCPRWPAWLIRLGDASYSVYLIQPFVLKAAQLITRRVQAGKPYLAGAVYLAGVVGGGVLLSRWVEIPVTRWAGRVWSSRRSSEG